MFLIDDILLSPLKGLVGVAKILQKQAYEQLYDPGKIREELMALQLQFELDEIDEEEYNQKEKDLLERLEESQKE